MKKIIILLSIGLGLVKTSDAQTGHVELKKLEDKDFVYALCNIDTAIRKGSTNLQIVLYDVTNPSGSAHIAGDDEISNHFLLAVSSKDEDPKQYAYSLGDFYSPKIKKFDELTKDVFEIIIEDGPYDHRKMTALTASLKEVVIK